MPDRTPIEATNLDIYGAQIISWQEVLDALYVRQGAEMICYLGTVRPDGRPHAAGVGAYIYDGDYYVVTSPHSQKIKNLSLNPAATLSTRVPGFDVTMEGIVERVRDPELLESLAALYREGGWPAEVEGEAFTAPYSAPSAGPPPWYVYRFRFDWLVAVALSEPGGATRWRFAD